MASEHSTRDALQFDVVIVGGGMVGVSIACALAPAGPRIAILENRSDAPESLIKALPKLTEAGFDPRVSALTAASQAFLTHVGAWDKMAAVRVKSYGDMDVWDGAGRGEIRFSADALHEPCLGHIVENRVTLSALYEVMQGYDNIEFFSGVQLDAIGAPAMDGRRSLYLEDGRALESAVVVAADGAHSSVRELAGIDAFEWDYGHRAIVTTVKTEKPHQDTCWQRFTEDGPLAFLPLADNDGCTESIVWSTSPKHAQQLMGLDDEMFRAELAKALDYRLGQITYVDRRHSIALRQRHARHYVEPGIALAGDAAHTIHPLAGQGVNLGFLDAAALAEVLMTAYKQKEALGDEAVLRRYQRARRSNNLKMAAAMEGFRRLFVNLPAPLKLLRSEGITLLDRMTPVKSHLVMMAMGLRGDVPTLARRAGFR